MFLQTATSVSGSVSPKPDDCLFMGCPSLVGATIRYARDQEIHGEKKDAKFIYRVASGALRRFKIEAGKNGLRPAQGRPPLFGTKPKKGGVPRSHGLPAMALRLRCF